LYLLLDILNLAHSTVRAACVFRLLNKKCYQFYLTNRKYLLQTQTFDGKEAAQGNKMTNWSLLDNTQLQIYSFSGEDESMLRIAVPFSHAKVGFDSAKGQSQHSA
jgi:hypothetical protein